tara:strand:- start:1104 stop:1355 length:252 start_codon:yes stop_codon:yes gene_type:complete
MINYKQEENHTICKFIYNNFFEIIYENSNNDVSIVVSNNLIITDNLKNNIVKKFTYEFKEELRRSNIPLDVHISIIENIMELK